MKLVTIDWFMALPETELNNVAYSNFHGRAVEKVPVIRIFGSTEAGQKCCLNLHGTLPYFFVPYPHELESINLIYMQKYSRRFGFSLEQALNVAFRKNIPHQYIHEVVLVTGLNFYGYSGNESLFMKIYFYNPEHKARMVQLLSCGAILNTRFQPFEAHIPFHLQVCLDFDLYGMDYIHFSTVQFRSPVPARFQRNLWSTPISLHASESISHRKRKWWTKLTISEVPLPFFFSSENPQSVLILVAPLETSFNNSSKFS